jgi:hypothetical protein
MNMLEKYKEETKEILERHVRKEFRERTEPMGLEEYKELRANSYEREHLLPLLDDEALEYKINVCMDNVTSVEKPTRRKPTSTYEQVLIYSIIPELQKRLKLKDE